MRSTFVKLIIMNHRFIAKAFPFVKTPIESRQVDASEDATMTGTSY